MSINDVQIEQASGGTAIEQLLAEEEAAKAKADSKAESKRAKRHRQKAKKQAQQLDSQSQAAEELTAPDEFQDQQGLHLVSPPSTLVTTSELTDAGPSDDLIPARHTRDLTSGSSKEAKLSQLSVASPIVTRSALAAPSGDERASSDAESHLDAVLHDTAKAQPASSAASSRPATTCSTCHSGTQSSASQNTEQIEDAERVAQAVYDNVSTVIKDQQAVPVQSTLSVTDPNTHIDSCKDPTEQARDLAANTVAGSDENQSFCFLFSCPLTKVCRF